jgi:hypothetical protein
MAGKNELVVGLVNDHFVHVPIRLAVSDKNNINPEGGLWRDVIAATGQHRLMTNRQGLHKPDSCLADEGYQENEPTLSEAKGW